MLACNAAMLGYCVQARAHARTSVAEQVMVCVRGLEGDGGPGLMCYGMNVTSRPRFPGGV